MTLSDREYQKVCEALHRAYPDDPRLARLWIRALVEAGEHERAARQALNIARRFVAQGMAAKAVGFIEIARRHGARGEDVERLAEMARLAALTGKESTTETLRRRLFELIEPLSDEESEEFLRRGRLRITKDGDVILRQGQHDTSFHLILEGAFEVRIAHEGKEEVLGLLHAGDFFGELAAVYDLPRSASVISRGQGVLLEFTAGDVRWLAGTFPLAGEYLIAIIERRTIHTLTHAHPAFQDIPEEDRLWVAENGHVKELKSGKELATEEQTKNLWIVRHGELAVVRQSNDAMHTMALGVNDAFGGLKEVTLPADVRIVAAEHSLLACIPRRIAVALAQAYPSFALWMEAHGKKHRRALGIEENRSS